jgi:hypothetical protein
MNLHEGSGSTSGIGLGSKRRSSGLLGMRCTSSTSLDTGINTLGSFGNTRATAVRQACEWYGIHLGLHTAAAVNVAEVAPFVGDAVERYLEPTSRSRHGLALNGSSCMPGSIWLGAYECKRGFGYAPTVSAAS